MIGGGIDGIKNDLRVLVHFRSSLTLELEQFQFTVIYESSQVSFREIQVLLRIRASAKGRFRQWKRPRGGISCDGCAHEEHFR